MNGLCHTSYLNPVKRDLLQGESCAYSYTLAAMIRDDSAQPYERMFALPPQHSLKLSSSKQVKRDGMVFETRWLDEHDDQHKLIARFRAWTNQSMKPPYRKQVGWERYSLSGELLDREIRYSKRDTDEYLH